MRLCRLLQCKGTIDTAIGRHHKNFGSKLWNFDQSVLLFPTCPLGLRLILWSGLRFRDCLLLGSAFLWFCNHLFCGSHLLLGCNCLFRSLCCSDSGFLCKAIAFFTLMLLLFSWPVHHSRMRHISKVLGFCWIPQNPTMNFKRWSCPWWFQVTGAAVSPQEIHRLQYQYFVHVPEWTHWLSQNLLKGLQQICHYFKIFLDSRSCNFHHHGTDQTDQTTTLGKSTIGPYSS